MILKIYNIAEPSNFPFIDNPGEKSFAIASQCLQKMGALDENGVITKIGRIIHEFPLDPYYSFCLYNIIAEPEAVKRDVITIIAIMNVDNLYFSFGKNKNQQESENRKQFHISNSDHLTKLNIFYKFVTAKNKKEFCQHFGLKRKSIDNIILIRDQLIHTMMRIEQIMKFSIGFPSNKKEIYSKNKTAGELLSQVIANFSFDRTRILNILKRSFFTKLAEMTNFGEYKLKDTAIKAKIHPESVVFHSKNKPREIVFNTLINTTKIYINNVSEIN